MVTVLVCLLIIKGFELLTEVQFGRWMPVF